MDRKTGGIIATLVSIMFCGTFGLASFCFGALATIVVAIPGFDIKYTSGVDDPAKALAFALSVLCIGVILLATPVVVGVISWRRAREDPFL